MRYGADQKQLTRERVLKAAARQIRERGPERIALAGVMAEAGLTHGGFYAHFKSKDDFLRATVEQMFADSPFAILRREGQSPHDALSNFVDFYLSPEHRDTRTGGCPLPFLSADAPRLPADVRERLAGGMGKMADVIAQRLTALDHADAESEASSCMSEIIGAVILARAEPDRSRSNAILARTRAAVRRRLGLEHQQ